MAHRKRKNAAEKSAPTQQWIVICRGGDCGSKDKHPGFDHRAQLDQFRQSLDGQAQIIPARCLDACDHSNVIVHVPADQAQEPTWIGQAVDEESTREILSWIRNGALPGTQKPVLVEINEFSPTRMNRHELAEELER